MVPRKTGRDMSDIEKNILKTYCTVYVFRKSHFGMDSFIAEKL